MIIGLSERLIKAYEEWFGLFANFVTQIIFTIAAIIVGLLYHCGVLLDKNVYHILLSMLLVDLVNFFMIRNDLAVK